MKMSKLSDNGRRLLLAAFGANTIAYLGWYALPEQWAALVGPLGQTKEATSMIVSAEILTAAIVGIIASFIFGAKAARSLLAVGTVITLLGHLLAFFANGYQELLGSRMFAGVGEGLLWVTLSAAVAGLDDPDRRFAQINAGTAVVLAIVVAIIPHLEGGHPGKPLFLALVVAGLLFIPALIPFIKHKVVLVNQDLSPRIKSASAWLLVIGVAVWAMTVCSAYSLAFEIGMRTGADPKSVSFSVAVAFFGIIFGCTLTSVIGTRFGRVRTFTVMMVLQTIFAFVMVDWTSIAGFTIGLMAVNFSVYCAYPYLLGLASDIDRSGGCAAAVACSFALGGGASPMFGSYLISQTHNYSSVSWAILLGGVLVLLIVIGLERSRKTLLQKNKAQEIAASA